MRRPRVVLLAVVLGLAACGGPAPAGNTSAAEPPMDGTPGMISMDGMAAGAAAAFWDSMRAHLDSVVRLEPSRLVFVRAAHDSLTRRALERMDQDMAAMAMPSDGAWRALADSVRRDLTALRDLAGEAFVLRMRGNAGRLRWLIARHEEMMAPMKGMQ